MQRFIAQALFPAFYPAQAVLAHLTQVDISRQTDEESVVDDRRVTLLW